jgi:hypothetical protein
MSVRPALRLAVLVGVWLLLLGGEGLGAAGPVEVKDLGQPVAAGAAVTYLDLLKLVHPNLTAEGGTATATEGDSAPVRQIDDYFEPHALSGKLDFGDVWALELKARDQRFLVLRVSVSGGFVSQSEPGQYDLLALFQTAGTPKLLDLLDIKGWANQISGFWSGNPVLNLTPGTQALMIFQEHFNSSQSYLVINLLWVRNRRLETLLSVSPLGVKALCKTFATQAVFSTVPDMGREYPKVVARLTVKMEPGPVDEQCQPRERGFTRSYQGVWRWEPGKRKYRRAAGDLDELYRWYKPYY